MMPRALLLNADWTPLKFVSDVKAFGLLMKGRVEVITLGDAPSMWDEYLSTTTTKFQIPATVRLLQRANIGSSPPRFRKKVLYNRDGWCCQYCKKKLGRGSITIDHVVPRCRGGTTSWKNCVVSCKQCNRDKGSKLPHEVNMKLLKQPTEPRIIDFWDLADKNNWHADWSIFVPSRD